MNESYLRRAGLGSMDDFPETIRTGMQDYAERLAAVIREIPSDDYAMMVVVMEQCAQVTRGLTPKPLQRTMDAIGRCFSPMIISRVIHRKEGE